MPVERAALLHVAAAGAAGNEHLGIVEKGEEQILEHPADARIVRSGRCRPGGGFRHRLVVAAIDAEHLELAGRAWLETAHAPADPGRAKIVRGIEKEAKLRSRGRARG